MIKNILLKIWIVYPFLTGISLHRAFFQHQNGWIFVFIPALILTIWSFIERIKK